MWGGFEHVALGVLIVVAVSAPRALHGLAARRGRPDGASFR